MAHPGQGGAGPRRCRAKAVPAQGTGRSNDECRHEACHSLECLPKSGCAGESPMTPTEALDEFRSAGALLEGHFILSSGLHSPVFLQKMFIFQDPVRTARLCSALADKIRARFGRIDVVVSPA